jgi:HK97 family phage prohead protease
MAEAKAKATKREVGEHIAFHANFEPTKTKDLGEGIIEAVITTGAIDHHNETINMDGVDVSAYHGTVLFGHDYEGLPIGKTISLTKMKSKIKAKFQLAINEFPFANLIYNMIKGGYITDVSIGGIVRKWSDDYQVIEEMVMKEFSVVPIGANPEAMITAVKDLKLDPADVKQQYQDFARSVLVDKLSGLGDDEVNDAIKVLKNLMARLEESTETISTDVKQVRRIVLRDARAVATQSQRVIKTIKLKSLEDNNERSQRQEGRQSRRVRVTNR